MSELDNLITCALQLAKDRKHEYVTLEHLAVCCLQNDSVLELLTQIDCDHALAKEDLLNYLDDNDFNGLIGENPFTGKPKKTISVEGLCRGHLLK